MRRYFNTEGLCHQQGGRQYGKTTTLRALAGYLKEDYLVIALDFQMMSTSCFENEKKSVKAFTEYFVNTVKYEADPSVMKEVTDLEMKALSRIDELFIELCKFCQISKKPVVMMIDEVDSASNNQVFLDFLALLRGYYLERRNFNVLQMPGPRRESGWQ